MKFEANYVAKEKPEIEEIDQVQEEWHPSPKAAKNWKPDAEETMQRVSTKNLKLKVN